MLCSSSFTFLFPVIYFISVFLLLTVFRAVAALKGTALEELTMIPVYI